MSASDVIWLSWTSGSCDGGPCSLAVQSVGLFQETASFGVSVPTYWPVGKYSAFSRAHRMVLLQDGTVFPVLVWYLFQIEQMKLFYVHVTVLHRVTVHRVTVHYVTAIMWPCWIVTNFFIIKPTRCTNFTNLFCRETLHVSDSWSVHHQELIHCTLSNGICHTGL